jgi:cell division septum initiation protein DivIVA
MSDMDGDRQEGQVYWVFQALDELVTTVEEARGVPMTSSCVVPRGDVLELLDDIREAIPAELDDAQDVLDHRDELVDTARQKAEQAVTEAREEAVAVPQL